MAESETYPARARLLRKHPKNRRGYLPREIYDLSGAPIGWDEMKPMDRISSKINCFFDKTLIKEIRRCRINNDPSRNQYFMSLVDGTFVEVLY